MNLYFDKIKTKGRPKMLLNQNGADMIEKLAAMMLNDKEIASVLEVDEDTMKSRNNRKLFDESKERGMDKGKASLKRKQFEVASSGNVTMLIWLGKQYLGQKEQQETVMRDSDIKIEIKGASQAPKEVFEN